jgi:DNA-binding CsgD family transcriptional regulator
MQIARTCGVKPSSIKIYWTVINVKLGLERRQRLREWLLAQYGANGALQLTAPNRTH